MGIAYSVFTFLFVNSLVVFSLMKPMLQEVVLQEPEEESLPNELQEHLNEATA